MHKFYSIAKLFIAELLIIFSLLFLVNNYLGNTDTTIVADGKGYYDYLPSLFIHHDLIRKDFKEKENKRLYERIGETGVYVKYNEYKVDKYPCGTAILQSPFFYFTYLSTTIEGSYNDGYQDPYQKSIFYAALFYLFLSLIFFRKLLKLFNVKWSIILFCQLTIVFSTSVLHYTYAESSFSHIYSLFAITIFLFYIKSYMTYKKSSYLLLSGLFLGLVFLLRPPNIIVLLFIPFLAVSFNEFKLSLIDLFKNKLVLFKSVVIFVTVCSIQFLLWYLQTGNWAVYSYQGEGFYFFNPHFYDILFSYKKGLFIYTPILLLSILSIIWFFFKKLYYSFLTWISFFLILTYFLSSWWSWFYGCSYGLRTYIDFYSVFFIPIALMLNQIKLKYGIVIMSLALITIPLNVIQTYQYKSFILHWIDMDKENYWKVFLKTDEKYKGILWKSHYNFNQYSMVHEVDIQDIELSKDSSINLLKVKYDSIPDFKQVSLIQVSFENNFDKESNSKINLNISNEGVDFYNYDVYLIRFHEKKMNQLHKGVFNYEMNLKNIEQGGELELELFTKENKETLKNIKVKFFKGR